jgi:hypothetical protein
MVYDYMLWSGDRMFIHDMSWGIQNVLHWYDIHMQAEGMLGPVEWWNDMDWSPGFQNGTPPGINAGNSATLTLQYAISLQKAGAIFSWLGDTINAKNYLHQSTTINHAVRKLCYDPTRGLFAETPAKNFFSQHTNILAILSGAVEKNEEKAVMTKVLTDKSLSQVALLFRYFLLEAMNKSGLGDSIAGQLTPWFDMTDRGLTTFTEIPVTWNGQRSDCHPWATSPNIHFFSSICGISPITPGYKIVAIEPSFGNLHWIKASFPVKYGAIKIELNKKKVQGVGGSIILPDGVSGIFRFEGKEIELRSGVNKIDL